MTMATTYVTLQEKYEMNVNGFKEKTHFSLLVKFGLMKLTKLTTMSLAGKQSTGLAGIQRAIPFNLRSSVEFFIERLCIGLWSGCFSIFPPPIPYVSSFHCFIGVMGAWNGGS